MSSGRLDNTYTWIEEVEELASERSIQSDRAFAVWSMEYVYPLLDTDEALLQTDILRGNRSGEGGLFGWYKDDNSQVFHKLIRQIDSNEESSGLKSVLEKSSDNETLEQLWSSIDASARGMLSLLNLENKTVQDILLGNLN